MLLPFSCKERWFCPSCHEKKVLFFGEFITGTIAFPVPHPPSLSELRSEPGGTP